MPSSPTRLALALLLLASAVALLFVRVGFTGHLGGLFLLRGTGWRPYEVKDDLYLGEGSRLLAGIDFGPWRQRLYARLSPRRLESALDLEWDAADGEGYVTSRFPGGRRLVTCFSRFLDDGGKEAHGLFVGGGLPGSVREDNAVKLSETGMAWFDGTRWVHVWCSANEALLSLSDLKAFSYPSSWKFLGSRVIQDGPRDVVLASAHEATVGGVPLRIDRFAYFDAGETFFRLGIRIRNIGDRAAGILYLYGDEPWLGDFGSSKGNVGWTADGLVQRASVVDTRRHRFAGLFDCGNALAGEDMNYTMTANFIEWLGDNVPETAYFSNHAGYDAGEIAAGTPLSSDARFIGLQWGPRFLRPGEETTIFLAVGLASHDPKTGLPVKPDVPFRHATR